MSSHLLEEIQNRDHLVARYNVKTDHTVDPDDRKKFLGLLMVRAAEQGNIGLMDNCYNSMVYGRFKQVAWSSRLACVAVSLIKKQTEVLHHVLQEVQEYSSGAIFTCLLDIASQTKNLDLFDQTWAYVVDHNISIKIQSFNFVHILSNRDELKRLLDIAARFDISSVPQLRTIGLSAVDGCATDVLNNFVLQKPYDADMYARLICACSSLPPVDRHAIGWLIFNKIPSANHQGFVLKYIHAGNKNSEKLTDITTDLASYLKTLSNEEKTSIKNALNQTSKQPLAEHLLNAMTANLLNHEIDKVDVLHSTYQRKI